MNQTKLTHRFTHDGRAYTLRRRPARPTGIWYLHFEKNARRFNRSLDTTIQKTAETNARRLIAAVKEKRWTDLANASAQRAFADLESIIAVYGKNLDGPKEKTARANVLSFRRILRVEKLAGICSSELTPKLIRDYKKAVLQQLLNKWNVKLLEEIPEAERARAKRSANSTLRQARSLFAKNILPIYADAGLTLPDLMPLRGANATTFLTEPGFLGVPDPDYQIPSDQLIATTFRALHKLRTSGHPEKLNRCKAVCLAVGGGLRKSEIAEATWDWFAIVNDRTFIRGDKLCKNGRGLDLPFQTEAWQWLLSIKPADAQPTDYILAVRTKEIVKPDGSKALERLPTDLENIFRKISRWMRKLGWRTQKTIHEFRAYLLSKIVMQHGLIAGRDVGRHATNATTERNYGRYITTRNVDVNLTLDKTQAVG